MPQCAHQPRRRARPLATWTGGILGLAITILLASGCGPASLPAPPTAAHTGDAPVVVPYPPPPARVEMVPPPPNEQSVWVDGHWTWTGQTYAWTPGGWQHPPPGAAYAPPAVIRRANGQLVYYAGSWRQPRRSDPASGPRLSSPSP